jgi:hypothetical protein
VSLNEVLPPWVATDARHTKNPETIRSDLLPHALQEAHRFPAGVDGPKKILVSPSV